ncbi:glycosyltransferase [Pseudarthrobacter raffinosi]|uniref:glycosyltransferase n=1 Tax=Pseudarthrobacter raffinosi TaxID=2953651 RepID=UPI00208F4309|nr:glycosyltransferase [Pseudarthrobacter sp. MDT3-28]MCO4238655.1 hypothetical protein [Pseudarthrobacter sp. MDT3-28]
MSRKKDLGFASLVLGGLVVSATLGGAAFLTGDLIAVTRLIGTAGYVLGATVLVLLCVVGYRQVRLGESARRQLSAFSKSESRHDYSRRVQLDQFQSGLARLRFLTEGISGYQAPFDPRLKLPFDEESDLPRVLFVTSNGAGVGHLTRCLAVARSGREKFQAQFVSLSSSAEIVRLFGFDVLKFPSQAATAQDTAAWNDSFATFFDAVCRLNHPRAIVFDGTWIYRGVHESAKRHGVSLIWLRRGLWMDTSDVTQLKTAHLLADRVLVPRDVADTADAGPVSASPGTVVPAPTLTTPSEFLTRDAALGELGLDPARGYVLVQLGAGAINDVSNAREQAISRILTLSPSVDVVVGLSPLSNDYVDNRPGVHVLRQYPLARYLAAFDFMVIAAGYNSIHESVRFQTPAVVVPNLQTSTDNQALRAAEYERQGFGLAANSLEELADAIQRTSDPELRRCFRKALQSVSLPLDSGEGAASKIHGWMTCG